MFKKIGANFKIVKTASSLQLLEAETDFPKLMTRVAGFKPLLLEPDRFLYVRARAVSGLEKNGPNDNGDAFRWAELQRRYATFIGCPVNLDHKNDDLKYAIGWILDAELKHEGEYVDIIMAVNRKEANKKYSGLVGSDSKEQGLIETGAITDVSMGCYVDYSICSACGKVAHTPFEYCQHVANYKARKVSVPVDVIRASIEGGVIREAELKWIVPDELQRTAVLSKQGGLDFVEANAFEVNEGVTFFEESIITTAGADKDAKIEQVLASKKESEESWRDYLVVRVANANINDTKEGEMDKVAADKETSGGSQVVTKQDRGDYKGSTEVTKQTFQQAKGKTPKEDMRGSQLMTSLDRGEYVLASKDGQILARGKEQVLAFLISQADDDASMKKDEKAADEELGGKPEQVEKAEAVEEVKEIEDTQSKVSDDKKEELQDKKEDKIEESIASKLIHSLAKLLGVSVKQGEFTPMQTVDRGDYGAASQKDKETAGNASKGESESRKEIDKMKGTERALIQDRVALPEKVSGKSSEAVQFIVGEMQKGRSFDEAKVEAEKRYGEGDAEDKKEEKKESEEKPEEEKKEEASKRIEKRKAELKKLAEDKEEKEEKEEKKEAVEEEDKKEEKKEEACNASKKAAEELKGTDETKASPATDGDAIKEESKQEVDLGVESKGSTAVLKFKTADEALEKAKDTVEKMDQKAEEIEDKVEKKKEEAQLFARAGMDKWAEESVKDIEDLEKKEEAMDEKSDEIEEMGEELKKTEKESVKKILMARLATLIKDAEDKVEEVKADMEEKEKEEKKKEEARLKANQIASLLKENASLKKKVASLESSLKIDTRSKFVSKLARDMFEKGLIAQADIPTKIASLMKESEEALLTIDKMVKEMQKKPVVLEGSKRVEEAARSLNKLQNPIVQRAMSMAGTGSELEKGSMFE